MAIKPVQTLLFAGAGVVAVAGVAYVSGALDPLLKPAPPAQVAALPSPGSTATPTPPPNLPEGQAPAADTKAPVTPETPAAPPAAAASAAPSFDVVRAEGDGSLVVAGKAAPNAKVEILNGSAVIGTATAGPEGAFTVVLDDPLKPGDYQLTLRSTSAANETANSAQTAVVSIPDKADGQVLAMVEEAGKPSELLTVPEAAKPDSEKPAQPAGTAAAPATPSAPSAQPAAPAMASADPAKPVADAAKIAVEAVEIDGGKVFVAGTAAPGSKVRAYASDILLGDALTSPDGHFLVEALRDLPVGNYTVRVDALDGSGKVIARAAVPFEREPGESIAAVAPAQPQPGQQATEPQAADAGTSQSGNAAGAEAKPAQPAGDVAAASPPAANQPATAPTGQSAGTAAEKPADIASATPTQPAETTAPKLQHADGAVIIRRGDNLWRISRRIYGHGIRYSTIYLANQEQISDPDRIWPGQIFKVPEKSSEGEAADMKAMGEQATIR